ncbi:hypothetical protein BYT27DRAFT_7238681 [Phlegmacium glaucopus]|nr:hypothetical protein BYT27DRAFT_7238681 [Phlegmacium glaucopus]
MGFTDFLFPPSTPLFPPAATVLKYLESYTDHFDLRPHIHFNTSVISAEYGLNGVSPSDKAWNISTRSVDSEQQINHFKFDWLFVCNGHYSVPRYPSNPGLSTWVASGKVSHSVTYRNPSLLPLPNSAKVLVIGGGPSGQDIVADLLSSPFIGQVIHSTSTPPTIAHENPKLIHRPRTSQFFTPDSSTVQFCDSSIESSISYCILATGFTTSFPFFSDDYLRPSIPPSIPPLPDMSILYNTSYGIFPLARHLFPLSGSPHKPNIAFPGLLMGVAPLPLTQIQARAALALFEKLDQDPENSNMDWTQESLDILTRYEKLKIQIADGDLNSLNDVTSEAPFSLEEKIAKEWYRFKAMEQFEYRDSLVEFINRLSSTSSSSSSSTAASASSPSLPSALWSASSSSVSTTSSNLDSNPSTNLHSTSRSSSNPISRFLCKQWERDTYTHKVILRRTWQALERSGKAEEWVRGVGEGGDPEKEWVELIERVIKRGFEMEGGK